MSDSNQILVVSPDGCLTLRQTGRLTDGRNITLILTLTPVRDLHLAFNILYVYDYITKLCRGQGRAIAEAVSRWLPTAAARVRARVWSSGICGGQSGAGADFLRVLRFPCHSFHNILRPHNHLGRYNRPVSGRRAEWNQFELHPPLCNAGDRQKLS
jgi:hypothetical protein